MNELIVVFAGATGAAVIKLIDGVIQWLLARKDKKDDRKNELEKEQLITLDTIRGAMVVTMLDRIQYLCKSYLKDGYIDYDDRHRLHLMHDSYHALGGNGDLNLLMKAVDDLPLVEMKVGVNV